MTHLYKTGNLNLPGFLSRKFLLFGFLLIILAGSCKKSDEPDTGNVSFGVNTHVINCIATGEVFIDNNTVGTIPGSCDTVIDCNSDNTLNATLATGTHSYRIEVTGQSGSCFKENTGDFELKKDDCIKIFFDLTE